MTEKVERVWNGLDLGANEERASDQKSICLKWKVERLEAGIHSSCRIGMNASSMEQLMLRCMSG